jgi:hypothetical protein
MGELGVALIAAGSAVAGSVVTGWFTRSAGQRQAAAAQHAGDRQADALLQTVRALSRHLQQPRQAREGLGEYLRRVREGVDKHLQERHLRWVHVHGHDHPGAPDEQMIAAMSECGMWRSVGLVE